MRRASKMIFEGKSIENLKNEDILYLIEKEVPENEYLDYKMEPWKKDELVELLKDITAIANNKGGYIILGLATKKVKEKDIPSGYIKTIQGADSIAKSILKKCRNCIDPNIHGLQCESFELLKDNKSHYLIIVWIPPSDEQPHGGKVDKANFFVKRQGHDTLPLPTSEIDKMLLARRMPNLTEIQTSIDEVKFELRNLNNVLTQQGESDADTTSKILNARQLLEESRRKFTKGE